MALRFAFLFSVGIFIGAVLIWSDRERPEVPLQKSLTSEPRGNWPYENYAGFCYTGDPLDSSNYTRGDLFLWGQPRGDRVQIRGALYKLRGPENDKVFLGVQGGSGFQNISSRRLRPSRNWKKVPWRGRLPRFVERGSPGEFLFDFKGPLLDRSCTWKFVF